MYKNLLYHIIALFTLQMGDEARAGDDSAVLRYQNASDFKLNDRGDSMKKVVRILFSFLALSVFCFYGCSDNKKEQINCYKSIDEVSFDDSMGRGTVAYQKIFSNPEDVVRFDLLKSLYEKNVPSRIIENQSPKIPKILHQIWLGPKTPPPYFSTFKEKWCAVHPDWEYKLWTDSDIADLNPELADLIAKSPNYAEKSDILRSEILDQHGGVYFDVDMECHHALDELHHKYDMYIGVEYPHKIATTNNQVWLGISIMAAKPNHPVIKRWKEMIRANWDRVNREYTSPVERVINHTYFPFTLSFLEKFRDGNLTNIAFPATYFYPLSATSASKRRGSVRGIREKVYEFLEKIRVKSPRPFSRVYPETIAVHYWGNTWIATPREQIKDLQGQLDILRREFYRVQQRMDVLDDKHKQSQFTAAEDQNVGSGAVDTNEYIQSNESQPKEAA